MGCPRPYHGTPARPSPPAHAAATHLSAFLFLPVGFISAERRFQTPNPRDSPFQPSSPPPVTFYFPLLASWFGFLGLGGCGLCVRSLDHSLSLLFIIIFLFVFCLHFCMPLFFCIAATVEAVEAREGMARIRRETQNHLCVCLR